MIGRALPRSGRIMSLFQGRLGELAVAGLVINACGLLLPIFSSLVYNKVIASGHLATLWALAIGMLIFAFVEVALRSARSFNRYWGWIRRPAFIRISFAPPFRQRRRKRMRRRQPRP